MATTTTTVLDAPSKVFQHKSSKEHPPAPSTPIELSTISTDAAPALESSNPSSPVQYSEPKQQWNNPRSNIAKFGSATLALFNMGFNDAAYGALLPFIQSYYSLDYLVVSVVFAAPFVGYAVASIFNHKLHSSIGQRGIAILSPLMRIIAYLIFSFHPPYPAFVSILTITGFGIGLGDAAWNAWMGDLTNSGQLLGLAHGAYGAGATISPLIATAMVVTYGLDWWQFFYVPLGLCILETAVGTQAFWHESGAVFREKMERSKGESGGKAGLKGAVKNRVTWIVAAFLFMYVGVEVSLGGWIVTFMLEVRNANNFDSGLSATGFWLGLTVGRVVLGFITPKIGERWAVTGYLLTSIGLELLFWLVPNFLVSAVMIGLLGFFLGPLFPSSIVAATRILPTHLHVSAIGFAVAIGGGGAAIVPFATGAIVSATSVDKLEPIVLALIVVLLGLWLLLPRFPKHQHSS